MVFAAFQCAFAPPKETEGLEECSPALPVSEFLQQVGELPPMLVEEILPQKRLFLLAGKPKAGKSFLALDIADCVCQGLPVFGKYRVNQPGPVIYFGMEDGDFEIAHRVTTRGIAVGDQRRLLIKTQRLTLSHPGVLASVLGWLEALHPSLVVIDTAAEALGIRDWLNRSEIIEKVKPIRDLARRVCTVLLVAHNRKAEGELGDEIAGSNAFTGSVDGWLSAYKVELQPNHNRRLWLRLEGRGGVRGEIVVEMDTHTLHFCVIPPDQLGKPQEAYNAPLFLQVAEAITAQGGLATITDMREGGEWSEMTLRRGVRVFLELGLLEKRVGVSQEGVGGRPAPRFCLTEKGKEVITTPTL